MLLFGRLLCYLLLCVMNKKPLMTLSEIANELGVSTMTVRRYISNGILKIKKIGYYYSRKDFERIKDLF